MAEFRNIQNFQMRKNVFLWSEECRLYHWKFGNGGLSTFPCVMLLSIEIQIMFSFEEKKVLGEIK